MKRKPFLVGLNLIAPGIGQLFAKMWLRGALELMAAISCALWAVLELVGPIAINIRNLFNDSNAEFIYPNYWKIGAALALLIMLYVWSIVELSIFYKEESSSDESAPPAQGSLSKP